MKKTAKYIIELALYFFILYAATRFICFFIGVIAGITDRTYLDAAITTLIMLACIGFASKTASKIIKLWKDSGKVDQKKTDKGYHKLFLNGSFYGIGPLVYINELIVDYVIKNELYGKEECEFKIVKHKQREEK